MTCFVDDQADCLTVGMHFVGSGTSLGHLTASFPASTSVAAAMD